MTPRRWSLVAALIVLGAGCVLVSSWVKLSHGTKASAEGRGPKETGHTFGPGFGGRASVKERTADFERLRPGIRSGGWLDQYKSAFRKIFAMDTTRALALLETEPDKDVRRMLLLDVLILASADEIEAVLTRADRVLDPDALQNVYEQGLMAMVKQSPERALRVWEMLPPSLSRSEALVRMLSAWPVDQPVTQLFEFHQKLARDDDRGWCKAGLEQFLQQHRPEELAAMLNDPGFPGELTPTIEKVWGRSLGEGMSAEDLLHRTNEAVDLPERVWRAACERVIERRCWELADSIGSQPPQGVLEAIGLQLVGQMAQSDPPRTAAWVERLPPGPVADRMTHSMTTVWLLDDPQAASRFAMEWQNPRLRQLAALSLVSYLNVQGDTDGAQAWAAQIRDHDLQPHLKAGTFP